MAAFGLPAWRYLASGSDQERLLLAAVAERALEIRRRLDQNLAATILNAYARAQKRG